MPDSSGLHQGWARCERGSMADISHAMKTLLRILKKNMGLTCPAGDSSKVGKATDPLRFYHQRSIDFSRMRMSLVRIGTLVALVVVLMSSFIPVHVRVVQLLFLASVFGAWFGFLLLLWNHKNLKRAMLLPMLTVIPLLLPGGKINEDELRHDYVANMVRYEGTKYEWGGEGSMGIDCSGLPRRAFRDALLAYGVRHFNGRALRAYLEHWWFDASARALAAGYRDYTRPIGISGTVRGMENGGLAPGDLAVTANGVHVMAYVGDGRWIQADPGAGKVVTLDGHTADNGWFRAPITTHRWRLLVQP